MVEINENIPKLLINSLILLTGKEKEHVVTVASSSSIHAELKLV